MYRVATTLSPSVMQKFMRLGCSDIKNVFFPCTIGSTDLGRVDGLRHAIDISNCVQHGLAQNIRRKTVGVRVRQLFRREYGIDRQTAYSSPWINRARMPIGNLEHCSEAVLSGADSTVPVFPATKLKSSSGSLDCSFRLILGNSAIPPLCMNCRDVNDVDTMHSRT